MARTAKKTKGKIKNFSSRIVVKRRGHTEKFDERKIYASVYESCHLARMKTTQAEKIASAVAHSMKKWAEKMDIVSAHQLHVQAVKELRKHHKDVAYMYETHKDLC